MASTIRDYIVKITANSDSYRVEMERAKRIGNDYYKAAESGSRRLDASLASNRKSIQNVQSQMVSLTTVAKSFIGAMAGGAAVGSVASIADSWGQMAARIRIALNSVEGSTESYANVQERLLEVSNRNARSIEQSQELFVASASSMKELGFSTNQTLDYIETLSNSFTINATSAQRTDSAINALSKSIATGRLDSQAFQTVLAATPTIVDELATYLGKTGNEVRQLGLTGKISMRDFANAMIQARDRTSDLADSMENSIADGLTQVANSFKSIAGEANQTYGVTYKISGALKTLSQNMDTVVSAGTVLVGIGLARYFGNMSISLKNATLEYINNTKAVITKTAAQRDALVANLQELSAQEKSLLVQKQNIVLAQTYSNSLKAQTALSNQLAVVEGKLTAVRANQTAATTALTAANNRLSIASNLAKGALGLVGGPLGAAMIAGGALYYFAQQSIEARDRALNLGGEIDKLTTGFENLTDAQLELRRLNLLEEQENINKQIATQQFLIDQATQKYENLLSRASSWYSSWTTSESDLNEKRKAQLEQTEKLNKLLENEQKVKQAISDIDQKRNFVGPLPVENQPNNKTTIGITKDDQDKIDKLYKSQLDRLNSQIYSFTDITELQKIRRQIDSGTLKDLSTQQQIALKVAAKELDRLNSYKKYQDLLLSLRTPEQKQLDEMREKVKLINQMSKSEQERLENMKLLSKQSIESAPSYSYTDSYSGLGSDLINVAESEKKLNDWYTKQKEMQKAFLDEKVINQETYNSQILALDEALHQKQDELQSAYQIATLGMFSSVTGQIADMFKETAGESSAAYKTMFLASKAASIAQAIISTEVAANKALELGPIAGIPAASLIRGLGYASVGLIAGQTIAGMAHDGIDNVPKEGTWLLDRGERVVDARTNADLKSFLRSGNGNGSNITVNVPVNIGDSNMTEDDGKQLGQMIKQSTISIIQEQMRPGGLLNKR